jgi:4-amino-4-deoxy-L-arabinose transferase-like glycosyltransferase
LAPGDAAILKSPVSRRILSLLGASLLLAVLCAELALSARQQSQTSDEACHILAGYRSWKNYDFGINPEHPPLVKLIAALPLLHLPLQVPPLPRGFFRGVEFLGGSKFLYSNDADAILFRARMAAAVFTIGLAFAVFISAFYVWGIGPAFLALTLLVFEPNLLAHGALVTTDMGVTFGLFVAVAAYSAYLKRASAWKLVLSGVASGVALSTKHSGVLVVPILILLALAHWWLESRATPTADALRGSTNRAWRIASSLAIIFMISVGILWACYGFRYSARPGGLQIDPPLSAFASEGNGIGSRIVLEFAHWKLLPESYLYGLADVFGLSNTTPTFLFGKFYTQAQWIYFPSVLVIKSTLGFLLLLILLPLAKAMFQKDRLRDALFLIIPAAFYFLVAMNSGVNFGVRHILPIFPFLIVLLAAGAWNLAQRGRGYAILIACLVTFHVVSSVRAFPNYIPYSNEVWGGPAKTYRVLSDSNVDWSQGLRAMRLYIDRNNIRDCWFAYFGSVIIDSSYYGISCKPLPTSFERLSQSPMPVIPEAITGPIFLSASEISGPLWGGEDANPYVAFRQKNPAAVIAGSILVFEGQNDVSAAAALTHDSASFHLLQGGELDRALSEAEIAVSLSPNSSEAHAARGNVLAKMKRDDDAAHEFEIAREFASGTRSTQ